MLGLLVLLCASTMALGDVEECLKEHVLNEYCDLRCCGQGENALLPSATFLLSGKNILRVEPGFSNPQCKWTDREKRKFECWTKAAHRCQYGLYTCEVWLGQTTVSAEIDVSLYAPSLGETTPPPSCYPPVISNVVATKLENGFVKLTWNFSRNESYSYCNGSRQFYVAHVSYRTYDEAVRDNLDQRNFDYQPAGRRKKEYIFTALDTSIFHRFVVTSLKGRGSQGFSRPVMTRLQHFVESVPLEWRTAVQVCHKLEGEPAYLSCEATGFPKPTVTYIKVEKDGIREIGGLAFPKLQIDDGGAYICKACHDYFDNNSGTMKHTCIRARIVLHVIAKVKDRECSVYTGQACSEFIHKDWKIFQGNDTLVIENHLTEVLDISDHFSMKCTLFIKSVLCHSLLPYCDPFTVGEINYNPLQICNKTCRDLQSHCGKELESFGDPHLRKRLFENCAKASPGPGDKPGCIFVNADSPMKDGPDEDVFLTDQATMECFLGNGRSYRGHERNTSSGTSCQKWTSQWPHEHLFDKLMGAELDTASRFCRNPGGLGERPWCFLLNEERWEYCNIPNCEQCVPYTGDFCTDVDYTEETVVFFRKNVKDSLGDMELELRGSLHAVQSELTPGCERTLLQLLCYGAMPTCNSGTKQAMCEQHCQLLDLIRVCPVAVQDVIKSIDYLDLKECNSHTLPRGAMQCLPDPVHLTVEMSSSGYTDEGSGDRLASETCYYESNHGQTYVGDVSITKTHTSCLPWSDQPRSFSTQNFPELGGAFCRNPGQLGQRPWCFTDTDGQWDYCNVSICVDTEAMGSSSSASNNQHVTYITVFSILFIVGISILAMVLAVCGYRSTKHYKTLVGNAPNVTNSSYFTQTLLSPNIVQMMKSFCKIEKSKIKYVKQLGQGNFGIVFQGECDKIQNNEESESVKVAVKTLKQESNKATIEDFVREAKLLHGFDHPNIVKLYGVCMEDMPFYMIFEFMDQGDLCQFLRTHSSSAQQRYNPPVLRERLSSSVSTDSATLGTTDLFDICKQIANGMAYLESKNHIHRDLACRNCLVNSGMIIKIADFGMSQNLYSRDYYRVSGEACLPVRWMPPESIIYGTFSSKGDMWSFGVVVWEIFNFGMQPYWGLANDAVVEMVRHGKLLEKPESCPDKVYSLIKEGCWCMYESERMSFATLNHALSNFRLSDSDICMSIDGDMLNEVFEDAFFIDDGNDDDKD